MKTTFLTTIFLLLVSMLYGQATLTVGSPLDRGSPLREIKSQVSPPVGSVYLDDAWTVGTLDLVKGALSVDQLKDVVMRLDLRTNTFELQSPSGVKELEGSRVKQFSFVNSKTGATEVFFNCNKFKVDGASALTGFCKMTGNKIQLARHSFVKFVPANYDATLLRGSKEDQYVKNTSLYFVTDGNLLPATKKNCFDLMADKEPEIRKFIKENRINTNKEEELALVVLHYDSLSGSEIAH